MSRTAALLSSVICGLAAFADTDLGVAARTVRGAKATASSLNTALVPVSRLEQDSYDWWERHERIMASRRAIDPEVVFIGDSITHFWAGKASVGDMRDAETLPRWKKAFGSFRTLNLGFGWDRTGNVLKRLELGELDGLSPRVAVIHIGGNNFFNTDNYAANTPREVADGILEIVRLVHAKIPRARLVVASILPFGELPGQLHRTPIKKTNEILAHELKRFDYVTPIDVTSRLLTADGCYPRALAADSIHPTDAGYDIIAGVLVPILCRYVGPDVFIGTQGLGHVSPAAAWPFGMVQAGPDTSKSADHYAGDWPHTCGYQFDDGYLWRFSQCRFYGIGCGSMGFVGLLPSARPFSSSVHAYSQEMDKATEWARPGFYAVTLKEGNIGCEMSALAHSAAYRFSFGPSGKGYLLVDPGWGTQGDEPKRTVDMNDPGAYFSRIVLDCEVRLQSPTRAAIHSHMISWNEIECWSTMEFSAPVKSARKLREARFPQGEIWEYEFEDLPNGVLEVRLALSRNSIGAAARNLAAEMPAFDFEGTKAKSALEWSRCLSRIRLADGTDEDVRRTFEAAYYRTLIHPSDLGDVGGKKAYSNMSLWDIFRACSPLQTIVAPDRIGEIVESMLDIFDRQGYLPILHNWGTDNHCMVGHHAVPIIVDAYLKGIRGFDPERAYAAIKDSLTVMHVRSNNGTWGLLKEDWDLWDRYGYYPFDLLDGEFLGRKLKGESVSRALECAYNDACAAKFAAALGKKDDAAFFAKRASNWRNVFDPSVGFMRGKDSKGAWREPFDPKSCGAGPWADNDFTEGNSWQYTWHVMHDVEGLVSAMGGKRAFGEKLEALFGQGSEVYGPSFTHDVSGLIGQYAHGNEPSHHVAYLFRYSDRPGKTDETVRRICRELYKPTPDGCCGNDDSGQMAAWYVFSSLGLYPVDACGGEYVIGSPQVPGATLNLPNGNVLEIAVKGDSGEGRRVGSVTLNGAKAQGWKLRYADLLKGGRLEFELVGDIRP